MELLKKISNGKGFREGLVAELEAAGAVLLSWEEAGCGSCGNCPDCEAYNQINWKELELFFDEPSDAEGAMSFFNRAKWLEELSEQEVALFLLTVPNLFELLEENYFNDLHWVEMEALVEAVAEIAKDGPIDEIYRFLYSDVWLSNLWIRELFYSRGGDAARWGRLEEQVGKAREELFYDAEAVAKFSLDELLYEPYTYDDPENLYPDSPLGAWGDVLAEFRIGKLFYSYNFGLSAREYPFKFSPEALCSLGELSGAPASVLEGLLVGAGYTAESAWKVWPWFYSLNWLWELVESAREDDGPSADFFKKAFGAGFFAARDAWFYGVLIYWIKGHRGFWGTKEENSLLLQAAKSPSLDEEGARLIEDALGSYWQGPKVWRALAGNSCAPLRLLKDLASDNLELGVPELEELARGSIAKKEEADKKEAAKKEAYLARVMAGEIPLKVGIMS